MIKKNSESIVISGLIDEDYTLKFETVRIAVPGY